MGGALIQTKIVYKSPLQVHVYAYDKQLLASYLSCCVPSSLKMYMGDLTRPSTYNVVCRYMLFYALRLKGRRSSWFPPFSSSFRPVDSRTVCLIEGGSFKLVMVCAGISLPSSQAAWFFNLSQLILLRVGRKRRRSPSTTMFIGLLLLLLTRNPSSSAPPIARM